MSVGEQEALRTQRPQLAAARAAFEEATAAVNAAKPAREASLCHRGEAEAEAQAKAGEAAKAKARVTSAREGARARFLFTSSTRPSLLLLTFRFPPFYPPYPPLFEQRWRKLRRIYGAWWRGASASRGR